MGKTKRMKPSKAGKKVPLEQEIEEARYAKPKQRNKIRSREEEEEQYVDANLSKKILSAAREQQRELQMDLGEASTVKKVPKLDDDDDDSDDGSDITEPDMYYEDNEQQINKEDEEAVERFMSKNPAPRQTLADIIAQKFAEKQAELETQFSEAGIPGLQEVDPQLKQMYIALGGVLKHYRGGKLPKCFKPIPIFDNWEQILELTDPSRWSAAAMYQATRLFTSNLKEREAEKFFRFVLLPRIRDDLQEYKRLNFHLYQALKKALFKPAAFMKGILLALVESGDCTLREAIIVGSVVAKYSVPKLQSAAALLRIAELDYTGASSIFMRILLEKKYQLPLKVVDAIVIHFGKFKWDDRELPVLWHQALLSFIQHYKNNLLLEQKHTIDNLLTYHSHAQITPEIRRELQHAKFRDSVV